MWKVESNMAETSPTPAKDVQGGKKKGGGKKGKRRLKSQNYIEIGLEGAAGLMSYDMFSSMYKVLWVFFK